MLRFFIYIFLFHYPTMLLLLFVVIRVRVRVVMLFAKTGHGDNELSFDLLLTLAFGDIVWTWTVLKPGFEIHIYTHYLTYFIWFDL